MRLRVTKGWHSTHMEIANQTIKHMSFSGTNLRTGQQGIFPAAQVCEIDLVEEICKGVLSTNVQCI